MISGMAANCNTASNTIAIIIRMYLDALSLKFQFLNFKASNLILAFNKKQLTKVTPIKNH
jgi:hypothetical protein